MARHQARMKLGTALVGEPPWRSMPHGVVVYAEKDASDGKWYHWEEWELLGYQNLDYWVEYDHDTRKVTLYWPETVPETIDPEKLRTGQEITATVDGRKQKLRVGEVGAGTIRTLEGSFTYDLQKGQTVAYAELHGDDFVLSVEKFDARVLDVYRGTVLDAKAQKQHFGKVVAPRQWRAPVVGLIVATLLAFSFAGACSPDSRTDCTPRSLATAPPAGSTVVSEDQNQICYRRPVTGIGGLGK
ncbi:DUF4178 domain-containing protein [Cellulomonas shaoxiangyii]|uniref:DUF4178 domain-containing protein n=1 Tax=Cellulomonas shaoxiangyii TaxID=2566013 RepID=A0A4V1CMA0_9CELL|nr:DUF4178 domain-containing protein [Cellulomonas shaoxiangyii]QCB92215.1 DUF4178 domain-containing protein [Cellulomonas shaoxiangyii]TGY82629.1 DUF4178 domain-containing protein [Cellulomonas shaoxiangyii]